ncbi:CKLF-like MARVEL transmembrane domain-containing protein 8b isoform X1 [Poecilia formosa]|uniref:CKLF-like MARVEL transmembrane domain-containing protein 8b isoform X1 n=1 Tax=Poecilia formosa TaxID=48698 RepID=UPI0007B96D4B|nr:PREDICTED: CKLF-like MARVEL transmembrane domain-containing protein 8 isoform X1 [Poecilia formosa]
MDRTAASPTRRVSPLPQFNISTSTLAFDQHFTTNAKGILLQAEILSGMLVWILIGGTDYFRLSALCWVMFVSILLWILTICLFIIYLTGVHSRIPQIPWTTLSLCFNCAAAALYLVTAVVEAVCVGQATRGRYNYNCWAASAEVATSVTVYGKPQRKNIKASSDYQASWCVSRRSERRSGQFLYQPTPPTP